MPQHIKSETLLLLLFFQPAPSSSMISVKTHIRVLLSLCSFSAPQSVLAKEAFCSQTGSGNPNPQFLHRWGNPGVTLGLAHSPKAPSWNSGQLHEANGHGPASQVAFRDAKARGSYLQGRKCPPCDAPGLLGGVILKSCLLCAVITMNTPTAARDLKRRKPLKEKLYMAKPLKSRGELDSSHYAGIFRW